MQSLAYADICINYPSIVRKIVKEFKKLPRCLAYKVRLEIETQEVRLKPSLFLLGSFLFF
jgi:hypothetical protein